MKQYEQKPIPLILRNAQKKYEVNPQALKFFSTIQGKVAVISVAGIYRTGKSFLLNKMILNSSEGFAVGPTTNAKTKGIWVWGKPLTCHNQDDQIVNVLVLDSQGLGSTDEDINHDLKLFSITLLMSSAFLYNTVGSIDQNAIDSLGLVLRLCQHLKTETYNDFPDFYWILRDFSLALVDKEGNSLTTKQYLQNCLHPQPGDSEIRNRIRSSIKQSFHYRSCFTFVRPLTDELQLQKLDKMQLDELRPQFVQQVIDFRKQIFQAIKTKTIKGKQIKGEMLSDLITLYVDEINGNSLPVIQTGWKYVCQKQCQNVLESAQDLLNQKIQQSFGKLPQTKAQFLVLKAQIQTQLLQYFTQKTQNNEFTEQTRDELKELLSKKMKKIEQQMHIKNSQQTKNFIKRQFEAVDKKIKQSQFKTMGQLAKQFEVFYQYYRKKCPYKDEIQVGLQYLMKKYSDSSLVIYKSMKNKKQGQITTLKQQLQKLSNQMILKQEKYKHDKQKLQDRLVISQSSLANLQGQNKQYANIINQHETLIDKLKNQLLQQKQRNQSENQLQLINLKKKIMALQEQYRQVQCSKGLEINNLKNTLVLKDNQLVHMKDDKFLTDKKLDQTLHELEQIKQQRSKTVDDLMQQLQNLKQQSFSQIKQCQQKLRTKISQIAKLQNCVQSKANQIESLNTSNTKNLNEIVQKWQLQKSTLLQANKQQTYALQSKLQQIQDELALTSKKLQQETSQKDLDLKMIRMQMQKQKAILEQKIQFLKRQLLEKDEKIAKLQQQNKCYLDMFQQKDDQINMLSTQLQSFKVNHQHSSQQFSIKFNEYNDKLLQRSKQIKLNQKQIQNLQQKLRQIQTKYESLIQSSEKSIQHLNQVVKQMKSKNSQSQQDSQKLKLKYQSQISDMKTDHSKNLEQQKRNIQLSIIQLKNYYQMEKQRLEKKILEDRKKYQHTQQEAIQQMQQKIKRQQKQHYQQVNELKNQIQALQDQNSRVQNQYEMKFSNFQQEVENQKKNLISKIQNLQKKCNQCNDQYLNLQQQTSEDRVSFIKKIQMLNFQISKKQKQLMQTNSKKENAQTILIKKDQQIQGIKKMMNQQVQNSLKKVQQTNNKYLKINQQYLQYKMDTQKDLALCRQRNQFLNSKVSQLTKQKQIGSSKNLQKIDKQKITELKQQIQKQKAQLLQFESSIESLRKQMKQGQSNSKKQVQSLQKQFQHQRQRLSLQKQKNSDLQQKVSSKNEFFKKQLQAIKEKYQTQRNQHYKIIEQLKQKNIILEDQKNNISWQLQKQVALLNDKIQYAQRQRDQARKQLDQSQKRLSILTNQLKKTSDRNTQDHESKKVSMDRRLTQQLQTMKFSMKSRTDQQQQQIKKLKDQIKLAKQKNIQLKEKLQIYQKSKCLQKTLTQEKQILLKQKKQIQQNYRQQKSKQLQEWKKKLNDLQKTNKQILSQINGYTFQLEKNQSKWQMERNTYQQKISHLQDDLEKYKGTQLQRNYSKSRLDTSKRSSYFDKTM